MSDRPWSDQATEVIHGRGDDKLSEKLRRLQAVADSALSSLELDDLLRELLDRTCDLLGAETASVLLLNPMHTELIVVAATGMKEVRTGARVEMGMGFAGRIAASERPAVASLSSADPEVREILVENQLTTLAGVPMVADGQVLGVLQVGTRITRPFSPDDFALLQVVAERAGLATQARMSQLDRTATLALQRSLLPARPAPIDGFDIAARYIPGARVGVGGDWYDVFALPSGNTGLVIGDVAGNGLRSAVVMGRIRSALRAYALESDDPADVLSRLDRKIQFFEPGAMATALYAVIDPDHRTATFSSAGHLPPLFVDGGAAVPLHIDPDPPLGAFDDPARRTSQAELPERTGLLMYTDGLVERRGESLTEGIDRLCGALSAASADQLCRQAVSLLRHEDATDDVAVMALLRVS
jgi:hypothetical protein